MSEPLNLLFPLDRFYRVAGRPVPEVTGIDGAMMPLPYRQLLVGDHDMTPTLEAFHGDSLHLRLLERTVTDSVISRLVVLLTDQKARPVEFGAIDINLNVFPDEARETVLGCRMPLGAILAHYQIEHESRPRGFFQVSPDAFIQEALCTDWTGPLYGRRNALTMPNGAVIADILEILPP